MRYWDDLLPQALEDRVYVVFSSDDAGSSRRRNTAAPVGSRHGNESATPVAQPVLWARPASGGTG